MSQRAGSLSHKAIALITAAIVAFFVLFVSSTAHAVGNRNLPTGDTLLTVDTSGSNIFDLLDVDPLTAGTSIVGSGSDIGSSPSLLQGAYNSVTGFGYWMGSDNAQDVSLYKVDLATGTSVLVAPLVRGGAMVAFNAYFASMAIGPLGEAFVLDTRGDLYRLNLTTGATTRLGGSGVADLFGFSYNPADGMFYAFKLDPHQGAGTGDLYTIETAGSNVGSATLAESGFCADVSGIAFDSDGMLWQACDGSLFSADPADSSTSEQIGGSIPMSIFIQYPSSTPPTPPTPAEPELAATGFAYASAGYVAFALLTLGVILFRRGARS
jgi:hypothetical protein